MSAETLRRAAALMRERASWAIAENDWQRGIAKLGRLTPKGQHMASWHPAVALTVADWLDEEAGAVEFDGGRPDLLSTGAVAVARAYLGETA